MPASALRLAVVGCGLVLAVPAGAADYGLYGEAVWWRLVPPGGGAESEIVGTFHVVDPALEPAIERALARLDAIGALIVEVDMDAAATALPPRMLLPEDTSLSAILGGTDYAEVAAVAAEYGLTDAALQRLAPWAVTLIITPPVEQYARMQAGALPFDYRLLDAAVQAGLPVATLETVEEQAAAFVGASEGDQVALLMQTVALHDDAPALIDAMLGRYVAGDLAALATAGVEAMRSADPAATARILAGLIDDRNRRMAGRLAPLLAERPYLVAIGALHLPGEAGVLALLAAKGWGVEPIP